jgi:hypothetical protein
VTVADDPGGAVSVSPAQAGTLTPAGATVALTVTVDQFIPCGTAATPPPTITVEPGGAAYSVCTSLPKRDSGARRGDAFITKLRAIAERSESDPLR